MEFDNTDSSSESGMSDSWSVIEKQAELDDEPVKQYLVERNTEDIEDIASNSSDGESLEVVEEDITAHVEYMSDEETDGFSVISDSDCPVDDEIGWAPNKRRIYVHCRNPVLNSWLNFILITVLATVIGLGLGHFIGSQENQFYPSELSKLQKTNSYNSPRDNLELEAQTLEVDKLTQSDKNPLELLDVLHKSEREALEFAQMSDTRTNELLDIMQTFNERTNYLLEHVEQYDGRTNELLEFVQKSDERTKELLEFVQKSDERTKELLEFVQKTDERINDLLESVQRSDERTHKLLEFVPKSDERIVKTSEFINRYDTIAETWKSSANLASKAFNNPALFKYLENGRETYVKTLGQTHSTEINTSQENVKSVIGENSVPFQDTMTINKPNKDSNIVPTNNVENVLKRESGATNNVENVLKRESGDETDPSKNVTKAKIVNNEQSKETGPLKANKTNVNEYFDKINKQVDSNKDLGEDESPKQSSWLERVSNLVLALTPDENGSVTPLMELAESFEQSLNNLKKSIASGKPSELLEKMKISAKKAQETATNLIHEVNVVKNKTLSKMLTKLTKFKNKLHDKWCYLKRQDNDYHILNWLESKIFEDCNEESNKSYKGSNAQNVENKRSVSNKMDPSQDNLSVSLKNTMKSHNSYENKRHFKKYNELSAEDKRKNFKYSKNNNLPDSNTRKIYKDRPAGEKHFGSHKNPNSQKHSKGSDQRSDDRKHSKGSDQRNDDRKHSKVSDQRSDDRKHSKVSDQRNEDRKHSKGSDQRSDDRKHLKESDQRNDNTNYIRDRYTKESCRKVEYSKEPNSIGKLSTQDKCSNENLKNGWTINDKGEKSCNISGEWVIKLSKGRETSRKNNERSDWLFERAKARKVRRETDADQSEWYFDRARKREHCRQHPDTDWCLSAKYSDLGANKYDKYHEDDDDEDDVEYWKTTQWSYQTPLRPLASAGKWFKNTFSEFKEKMNYYQNNQHKFNYV